MTSAFKLHLLAIALALSFLGPAAQSAKPAFWTEVRDEMNYRASEGTRLSVVGDQIEVTSGAVLVEPKLDTALTHAIERESMLYQLVHSSDKQGKGLKDRLMKMAAVLNIVTSRHGRYTTGTH